MKNKLSIFLKKFVLSCLSGALFLSTCACTPSVKAEQLSNNFQRNASLSSTVDKDFYSTLNTFSLELFNAALSKNENANCVFSPISVAAVIAMLQNGADGKTQSQIQSALCLDKESYNNSYYSYASSLKQAKEVNTNNSLWLNSALRSFNVSNEFLQSNADYFSAEIFRAPFDKACETDINNWVNKNTNGLIKQIFDKNNPISTTSLLYVINAILFEDEWAVKYEKSKIKENLSFFNANGTTSKVTMLSSDENSYIELANAKGFVKPYKNNRFGYLAMLPNEGTTPSALAASLTAESFSTMLNNKGGAVEAYIPEYKADSTTNVKETLKAIGVTDMFDDSKANFSKMTDNNEQLYCSNMTQKALIEVSRHGTKAAAVTWGDMKESATQYEKIVRLDRPFFYAIVDLECNTPLFMGIQQNI